MMEYVILAVMIAAAVTAAAIYFGNNAANQFGVAGQAMVGSTSTAERSAQQSMQVQQDGENSAHESTKQFSKPTDDLQKTR